MALPSDSSSSSIGAGTMTRPVCSQRLEGSRFGMHLSALANLISTSARPKRVKTGGSRERPSGSQL